MKLKIKSVLTLSLSILLIGLTITPISALQTTITASTSQCSTSDLTTIRVALLDATIPSFTSPENTKKALDNYHWAKGKHQYKFTVDWINDLQIITGKLNRDNYDVLYFPGIGKEFRRIVDSNSLSLWKNNIRQFIQEGGGYVGVCGGANIASQGLLSPEQRGWKQPTMWEWFMNQSALGLIHAKSYQDMADPYACTFLYNQPERIGMAAYIWYNISIEGTGISIPLTINNSHPLFAGYPNTTRFMRWVSGPALLPTSHEAEVIAWYPHTNLSGPHGSNATTIHAWQYTGPFSNIMKAITSRYTLKHSPHLTPWETSSFFNRDYWKQTDQIIETHMAGKAAGLVDTFGKGRLVIFGPHPEHPVTPNERLIENEDTSNNRMLGKGLFHKVSSNNKNPSYNWWIARRSTAWAAQIPNDVLPPIT